MKNFEGFTQMNEDASSTLLDNLYMFYYKKYKGNLDKFKDQVEFLVKNGELTRKKVKKFYKEMDIDSSDEQHMADDSYIDNATGPAGC